MKIVQLTTDDRESNNDYLTSTPYFGAAPTALLEGFAMLPDFEVHVISCAQQSMTSPAKLAQNIWFHSLHVPKIGWLRTGYQGCIRAVRRKIKRIRPDIVHGQGSERDCALEAVFSGFPNVITLHGIMNEQAKLLGARPGNFYWLAAKLEKFALPRSGGVFCNSEYTKNAVRSLARKQWKVPNPLREAFFRPAPAIPGSGKPILLNIGAISARKQQCELLVMAREMFDAGLKFELHFLGSVDDAKPYGRRFLDLVSKNEEFCHHHGFKTVDELLRFYDNAAAVVHVPSEEAFGLVVAEGLARNRKLFGFHVGGIPEISEAVEAVELVPPGDWPGLKQSISNWLANGSPLPNSAAPVIRQRYHPRVIAERHIEIYREVLSKSS